ncbi:MAG: TlpA family protein disulfide reductase [Azoarcus sp.]|jgi:peroxiredoxin|nr:TlpA family protein disulfide reductase [Azoarcus sp.]
MKLRLIAALAVVVLVAVGFFILADKPAAPEVSVVTLQGERLDIATLRGKVVLVNFWATTCSTCIAEMPKLIATHEKYQPQGLETLAIAMDYDPPEQVRAFTERNALPFVVAPDTHGAAAQAFGGVRLTPTTFLIDKQGRIQKKYLGEPNFDELNALLEKLLAEAA